MLGYVHLGSNHYKGKEITMERAVRYREWIESEREWIELWSSLIHTFGIVTNIPSSLTQADTKEWDSVVTLVVSYHHHSLFTISSSSFIFHTLHSISYSNLRVPSSFCTLRNEDWIHIPPKGSHHMDCCDCLVETWIQGLKIGRRKKSLQALE